MIDIAVTIDQEWAPVAVLDWLWAELARAGVRATLFATDSPPIDRDRHEVAIHPNPFRDGATGMQAEIERLLGIYPRAKGLRMHRLAWESGLEAVLAGLGVHYVSNQLIPRQTVRPFRLTPQLLHFPIFYMDHHELLNRQQFAPPFARGGMAMRDGELYVFDFHPNMLFTNAPSEEFYREQVHPRYRDAASLEAIRYAGRGCLDLFHEILDLNATGQARFITLGEAAAQYVAKEGPNWTRGS
jgi:hypothetical protein